MSETAVNLLELLGRKECELEAARRALSTASKRIADLEEVVARQHAGKPEGD